MSFGHLTACVVLLATICVATNNNEEDYQFSKGPIPSHFVVDQSYPDRTEEQSCRPIQIRIERDTRRYDELVTYSKDDVWFATSDSRKMSARLHSHLSDLADAYYHKYGVKLLVKKAWSDYPDDEVPESSLHYEGRSVRIKVDVFNASLVLVLAAELGFDWVHYATEEYVTFSVIPDVCDAVVDLVFIQDQSGSVGQEGHDQALQFMVDVVNFFKIAPNETQIGLVTYSTEARVEFDLDDFSTKEEIQQEISSLSYPQGWTATALGLFQAGVILNPVNGRGSRPVSEGIPKIAVLITDGRSNQVPIDDVAINLQNSGVQVFTVGISNIDLDELLFIASDPDFLHVFLLDSFNDAEGFVDFLSFTACDAPAIVEPGENTTTEVQEDSFRFFQTECAAFAVTVVIEQIDIKGKCSLYASNTVPNPGPLDNSTSVVKNEDGTVTRRTVTLSVDQTTRKVIYVSVRGKEHVNVFSIIIWDRIFNEEEYMVYVPEGIEGFLVIDLLAELSIPNESFIYRIADGNDGGEFQIGNITGRIETARPLDVAVQMQYKLAIIAENAEAACHRGRVMVEVIVIPHNLTFVAIPEVFVTEDAEVGTNLTRVVAMGNALLPIEYSILDGNIEGAFEIDSITGEISVASPLDFEDVDFYILEITASISNFTSISAKTDIEIIVLDVNEAPFFLEQCALNDSCTFSIPENEVAPAFVGHLPAIDPDMDISPNGTLTYILDSTSFRIDGNGTIQTNRQLDREDQDDYDFTVTVSDGGNPSLSVETLVTVLVEDINDNAPVFEQFLASLSLFESIRNGTPFAPYLAVDDDIGKNAEIIYSVDQPDLPFGFPDPTEGLLTIIEPLDFESVQEYRFLVVASNPDGLNTSGQVMITIMDVNDNNPVFEKDVYNANVLENSIVGTEVINVTANDADSGINALLRYSIIDGNVNNTFSIGSSSGVITTSSSLDREQVGMYVLTIRADDSGFPVRTGLVMVLITVDDINDNAPMFIGEPYVVNVQETRTVGEGVLTVMAVDLDQPGTPNSIIAYSILSGNVGDSFSIGSTTGEIVLIAGLDFETLSLFELEVLATDMGTPAMTDTTTVTINILNVNEHAPVISGNQTIEVREDQPVQSEIAQFNASDQDMMAFNFSILPSNQDQFVINSSSGVITLNQPLNFEVSQQIVVHIVASDGARTDQATLTVNVLDVNEFAPVFQGPFTFSIDEEIPLSSVVGTVTATDDDGSDSIVFSLLPSPVGNLFLINPVSGNLTTNALLDREVLVQEGVFQPPDSQEHITVIAMDTGTLPHSMMTEQNITIVINDINDNSPMFELDVYQVSVPENMLEPVVLFTASATDPDLGANSELSYSLAVSNLFSIDSLTGQVSVNEPLDREAADVHIFTISVSDGGTPSLTSTVQAIVAVTDVNDNAPEFSSDRFEVDAPENVAPILLLQVRPSDPDRGPNAEVSYSILGNENCAGPSPPSSCQFAIDSSGIFRVDTPLDFEAAPQYEVTLVATDGGMPPLSSTTIVVVTVLNEDEVPPTFLGPCSTSFPETEDIGLIVTSCPAEDFDDTQNTTSSITIDYSITEGNVGDTFIVDESGNIMNTFPLDRESIAQYTLQLTVTDLAGLASTMQVIITITDINDNAPRFLNGPFILSAEAAFVNDGFLVQAEASDLDEGVNAEITYSLINVEEDLINGETTGIIVATDGGSPPLSTQVSVNITFSSPCTLQRYEIESSTGIASGVFLCSVDILPPEQLVIFGSVYSFDCNLVGYIPAGTVRLLHNGSFTDDEMTLSAGATTAMFQRLNATFIDSGAYTCQVMVANLGSLVSPPSVVSIGIPPSFTFVPTDTIALEGQNTALQCASTGVPTPVQVWVTNTLQVLTGNSGRFNLAGDFLVITFVERADEGTYTCRATNVAGEVEASALLTVVGQESVVIARIERVSDPDIIYECNSFDRNRFQDVMGEITSQETVVTSTNGTSLCDFDPCHPNPCQNNGQCNVTDYGSYQCTCLLGYTGTNCETDIDECAGAVCLNDGICTNTHGAFECDCRPGFIGDQCQYHPASCLCPPNEDCIELESVNTCEPRPSSKSQMLISQPVQSVTILNQQVNLFQEDSPSEISRRRKRDSSFVTSCIGTFYSVTGSEDMFALSWECPVGVDQPTEEELAEICLSLVQQGLVRECTTPGRQQFSAPDIPSSTVDVFFVIMNGETGRPLNASEALDLLEKTNALQRLQDEGFGAVEFRAAVPASTAPDAASTNVAAIVGGVLAAAVLVALVGITVAVVLAMRRRWRSKNSSYNAFLLSNASSIKRLESRLSKTSQLMTPINDSDESCSVKYELKNGSQEECPQSPDRAPYSIFDDPIYGETNLHEAHHKPRKKTLSFGKKVKLNHTDSLEKLLDDSEESFPSSTMSDSPSTHPQLPPKPATSQQVQIIVDHDDEEQIYGNMNFEGGKTAGERWENYWKTATVLRGVDGPPKEA